MSKALQTLNSTECEQLLEWILVGRLKYLSTEKNTRDILITLLMLDAGLRVGEVVQLKVHDLFFGDHPVQTLIVRSEIAKRGVERSVPMTERLQHFTSIMYTQHHQWRVAQCSEFAFTMKRFGEPLSVRCVQMMIRSASFHAFGRKIHPHVLRHTFATRLMQKTNIRVVQQLLGHASIATTQIYMHPNSQDLKNAIQSL